MEICAQTTEAGYKLRKREKKYKCRKCGSFNIKKNGKNRYGSQQYYCKDCRASGVLEPKVRYTEERKKEILKAYLVVPSMREIERVFGVSRHTVSKWIKKSRVSPISSYGNV